MDIDVKDLKEIQYELDSLKDDEILYVNEDGENRYVILKAAFFEQIRDLAAMIAEHNKMVEMNWQPVENVELTYEEYETVKEQIIDALEKTFMPKPEKLN